MGTHTVTPMHRGAGAGAPVRQPYPGGDCRENPPFSLRAGRTCDVAPFKSAATARKLSGGAVNGGRPVMPHAKETL